QANSAAFAAVQRKLLAKTSNNLPQISQIADNKEVLNEFVNLIVMLSQVNLLADPKFKHYLTVVRAEPDVRLAVRKKLGEKPIKSERIIVFLEMSIATEKNKIKYFLGRYNKLLEA